MQELPEFEYVEINGLHLPDPHAAYSAIWCVLLTSLASLRVLAFTASVAV